MDDKQKRDVREVLTEYFAAKARRDEYQRLRAELMDIIGEDHSHDPRNCTECVRRNQYASLAQQGLR